MRPVPEPRRRRATCRSPRRLLRAAVLFFAGGHHGAEELETQIAQLQLPGIVRSAGPDHLDVLLQRPDSPKVAEALAMLLVDLNHQTPRMLDGGPVLTFHLLDINRTAPSTDPLL